MFGSAWFVCCNSWNRANVSSKTRINFPFKNMNILTFRSVESVAIRLPSFENDIPVTTVLFFANSYRSAYAKNDLLTDEQRSLKESSYLYLTSNRMSPLSMEICNRFSVQSNIPICQRDQRKRLPRNADCIESLKLVSCAVSLEHEVAYWFPGHRK